MGDTGATAESMLRFPLEVLLAELELSIQSSSQAPTPWDISLELGKHLYDPVGIIEDSDWLSDPAGGFVGKVAFTRSDADADVFVLDVRGGLELLRSRGPRVYLISGCLSLLPLFLAGVLGPGAASSGISSAGA